MSHLVRNIQTCPYLEFFSLFYSSRWPSSAGHSTGTGSPSPSRNSTSRASPFDIDQPSPCQQSPAPDDNGAARVSSHLSPGVGIISPWGNAHSANYTTGTTLSFFILSVFYTLLWHVFV